MSSNTSSRTSRTVEEMKKAGEKYVESAGVELKFNGEDQGLDWDKQFGWNDHEEIVKRCMAKYAHIVPNDTSKGK